MLLSSSALCGVFALPNQAAAQSAAQMQSIEGQINALQSEIGELKSEAAAQKAEAAEQRTVTYNAPAMLAPAQPAMPPGTFQLGAVTVTLGGFAALEGVYRTRNEAASIDTNFNGNIPLRNSPNYHIPEFRETAQQSRFDILVQAQPNDETKLSGYLEADFLSAGSSSNNNQSNSYTPRVRQFWGMYENSALGLHVVGGQTWSLVTMYGQGLLPRHEQVPLTIDAQYVVGFDWSRQATFRVVKDFDNQHLWAAISAEEPATVFSSSESCPAGTQPTLLPGYVEEDTQCGGPNVNSTTAYSDNFAPDVIAKVAADPGYGHYELYGIMRFLDGRTTDTANNTGRTYETTGQGIGGGMILPVIPKYLTFQVNGLVGKGVGRYGTAQLPDATFSPTGKIEALGEYSVMGGFVAHPVPAMDVYTYGGAEAADSKSYFADGGHYGYGVTTSSLFSCELEGASCAAQTSGVLEGSIGAWYRFLKNQYGTVEAGAQYEYIERHTFVGAGERKGSTLAPSTNENAVLFSLRYLPFG
jgi:hypothetical protein